MDIRERVAKNLCTLRTERELSKSKFAEMSGISRRQYTSYENGDVLPSLDVLERIARAHNVTTSWLVR